MQDKHNDKIIDNLKGKHYEKAFNLIVEVYSESTYWQIRRMVLSHEDTNDLVQETFIRVWKNLASFSFSSQFKTWLFRITYNCTLSFIEKNNKIKFTSIDQNPSLLNKLFNEEYFCGNEAERKLQIALLSLPQQQRSVFNMRYYKDLKFSEIAEIMNLSLGGVKSNYHVARKKIEKYLIED